MPLLILMAKTAENNRWAKLTDAERMAEVRNFLQHRRRRRGRPYPNEQGSAAVVDATD